MGEHPRAQAHARAMLVHVGHACVLPGAQLARSGESSRKQSLRFQRGGFWGELTVDELVELAQLFLSQALTQTCARKKAQPHSVCLRRECIAEVLRHVAVDLHLALPNKQNISSNISSNKTSSLVLYLMLRLGGKMTGALTSNRPSGQPQAGHPLAASDLSQTRG